MIGTVLGVAVGAWTHRRLGVFAGIGATELIFVVTGRLGYAYPCYVTVDGGIDLNSAEPPT